VPLETVKIDTASPDDSIPNRSFFTSIIPAQSYLQKKQMLVFIVQAFPQIYKDAFENMHTVYGVTAQK